MIRLSKILPVIAATLALAGCVYDFVPDANKLEGMNGRIVVIEGDIVAGGITSVRVGYTLPFVGGLISGGMLPGSDSFWDPTTGSYESWKASVWVESEDGRVWGAQSQELGEYTIDTEDLDIGGSYRLCVSIPDKGEYVSEFRKVLVTPQIDKLSYSVPQDSSCVHFEVSTKGESNETGYYRWEFEEAWDNSPQIIPQLVYSPTAGMRYISEEERTSLEECFMVMNSTEIIIANTGKLQQNIILGERLSTIDASDNRIAKGYCITVTQTSLDKEGYTYWEAMKKNTSGTGGLFAPQPSEVRGNIKSVLDPDEVVIGYINVTTKSEEMLYVTSKEIGIYDSMKCAREKTYYNESFWSVAYSSYGMRPVSYLKTEFGNDITTEAHWAPKRCVAPESCTKKPEYWPEI